MIIYFNIFLFSKLNNNNYNNSTIFNKINFLLYCENKSLLLNIIIIN